MDKNDTDTKPTTSVELCPGGASELRFMLEDFDEIRIPVRFDLTLGPPECGPLLRLVIDGIKRAVDEACMKHPDWDFDGIEFDEKRGTIEARIIRLHHREFPMAGDPLYILTLKVENFRMHI